MLSICDTKMPQILRSAGLNIATALHTCPFYVFIVINEEKNVCNANKYRF